MWRDSRIRDLDGVFGPDIVLIDGLEPADVVVGVGDEVDVELAVYDPRRRVVGDVPCAGGAPGGGKEEEDEVRRGDRHGRGRAPTAAQS